MGKREAKKGKKIELSRSLFLPSSLPPENSLQELALDLVDGLVAGLEGDGVDSQRHRRRERRFFFFDRAGGRIGLMLQSSQTNLFSRLGDEQSALSKPCALRGASSKEAQEVKEKSAA